MLPRKEIVQAALEAPNLREKISQLVQAGAGSERTLRTRAQKLLLEIAADYNERWLGIWDKVLNRLWQTLYDDFFIDQEGMAGIGEISARMPCVLIPCHRSHVDYLIFSHILYKQKMKLPYVAAGANMNFWPLGYFFRQSGAFFLRRSFRGDELYREVFAAYLKIILQQDELIEFFLEGGRSRTGKMVMPKYGLLSMVIRSYQEGISDDLALIPVYLGYDRIIEENTFIRELQGDKKKSESVLDLLRSAKIMQRRYGNVYLNIGAPVCLKAYFSKQPRPVAEMSGEDQQALYRTIGAKVISGINRIATVTSVALVAASLLCFAENVISSELLVSSFTTLYDYLCFRKVKLSPDLNIKEKAIPPVLSLFKQWSLICSTSQGGENQGAYLIPEAKRLNLEYYKNNILYHFIPISFVALSILSCRESDLSVDSIREDFLFLKNIFCEEFIWEENEAAEIICVLSYLEKISLIVRTAETVACKTKAARQGLEAFAGLFGSLLESYGVVLNAVNREEMMWTNMAELSDRLLHHGEDKHAQGIFCRAESLSREYYKNALNMLEQEGVIMENAHRKENDQTLCVGDRDRLVSMSDRLSKFLK